MKNMEWTLNEGDIVKQVACVNDIAAAVKKVMNDSSEFVILTPQEPIGDCNFMQVSKISEDNLHFEVSIVQSSGKNRVYSKACDLDTAIFLFSQYFMENVVPNVSEWTFEGEYGA